jgi:hypothetical protein
MTAFFEYPHAASFGRLIPKTKLYEQARAGTKLRKLFVDQVDQIVWQYKLAPETINLSATKAVAEIQVFEVRLRKPELHEDILRTIDRAIAFPIIFEIIYDGKLKALASYKRPSEADRTKWVVSEYFGTEWYRINARPRTPLPTALNLGALYDKLLDALLPSDDRLKTPIAKRVERIEKIRSIQRDAERIRARLAREKQFNKRVEINAELRDVTRKLDRLGAIATDADYGSC